MSTHRAGFKVGPDNLPDGLHKRKVQKIKRNLIERAKVKRQFFKSLENVEPEPATISAYYEEESTAAAREPESAVPHPDRQRLMDEPSHPPQRPKRHQEPFVAPKAGPSRKEREEEKQKRREERARHNKTMIKARGGIQKQNRGQKKLGLESPLLLEKAKRLMNSG